MTHDHRHHQSEGRGVMPHRCKLGCDAELINNLSKDSVEGWTWFNRQKKGALHRFCPTCAAQVILLTTEALRSMDTLINELRAY